MSLKIILLDLAGDKIPDRHSFVAPHDIYIMFDELFIILVSRRRSYGV